MISHAPVFLKEALSALSINPNGTYIDATFGRGGHSKEMFKLLSSGALIICDRDYSAIETAQSIWPNGEVKSLHMNYSELDSSIPLSSCDGILADFGLCSAQLDDPLRGFSFMKEGPLDMRMDVKSDLTLKDWLISIPERELADALYLFGEEKLSRRIAKKIKEKILENQLNTTLDLAKIPVDLYPKHPKMQTKHPATRTFQALRIALNDELSHIKKFLQIAPNLLKPNGRLVIITFHSLEYSLVHKHYLPDYQKYFHGERHEAMKRLHHPLFPTELEIQENPRARSARLHVYQKVVQ